MTYCLGILLGDGLVLASDSRTNAGVDNISTFSKMNRFEQAGERVVTLLSAGNLAITQAVVTLLKERIADAGRTGDAAGNGGDVSGNGDGSGSGDVTLLSAPTMFQVARVVGEAMREVRRIDGPSLRETGTDFSASFIVAGQIRGEPPRLFLVYAAGNFIEATADTPFVQIGELKYGKPILDRLLKPAMSLEEAATCVLLSFDFTLRSNLSVGFPIDLLCYARDSFETGLGMRIAEDDAYFGEIRRAWAAGLQEVFGRLPRPDIRRPDAAPPGEPAAPGSGPGSGMTAGDGDSAALRGVGGTDGPPQ